MSDARFVALAAAVILAVACGGEEEQPGTAYWGLAEEWPFVDIRWRSSLASLVDEGALLDRAGAAPGSRFLSHEQRVREAADRARDLDIVREVMFIAGAVELRGRILSLEEVGECRFWVSPREGGGPSEAVREQLALGLAETQREAILEVFGATTAPCEQTSDATAAHLFVWVEGDTPPALPCREQPSFLGIPGESELGPTCP